MTRLIVGHTVVSVDVRVGAGRLEVVVVRNTGVGAGRRSRVITRAACGRVGRVGGDEAVTLAADDGAGGVLELEVGRAW